MMPIRLRWRLRTLMVIVAAVAVAIEAQRMRRRRDRCLDEAQLSAAFEGAWLSAAEEGLGFCGGARVSPAPDPDRLLESEANGRAAEARFRGSCLANAAYYAARERKYRRAAARPWLTVGPDLPQPD
jgi:hypothetical protein